MWCAVLVVFVLVVIYPMVSWYSPVWLSGNIWVYVWSHLSLPWSVKHGRLMNSHLNGNAVIWGPIYEFILVAKIWWLIKTNGVSICSHPSSSSPVPFVLRLSVIKAQVVCDTRKMVSARQGLKRVKCLLLRGGPNTTMFVMVLNEVNCFNWKK